MPESGDTLSVKLPNLGYMPAEVVWVEDGNAGISFEELLHEAVCERIEQQIR